MIYISGIIKILNIVKRATPMFHGTQSCCIFFWHVWVSRWVLCETIFRNLTTNVPLVVTSQIVVRETVNCMRLCCVFNVPMYPCIAWILFHRLFLCEKEWPDHVTAKKLGNVYRYLFAVGSIILSIIYWLKTTALIYDFEILGTNMPRLIVILNVKTTFLVNNVVPNFFFKLKAETGEWMFVKHNRQ